MKATLQYVWLTMKHRWFVLLAGRKVGVPMVRLLLHDLSKFGRAEARHYGKQFFGTADDPLGFSYAWLHHQRTNKHHWEAWIPVTGHTRGGYGDGQPLPMPEVYALEMLADWLGASRAYEGTWPKPGEWQWLEKNYEKIKLNESTRVFLNCKLREMGFRQ